MCKILVNEINNAMQLPHEKGSKIICRLILKNAMEENDSNLKTIKNIIGNNLYSYYCKKIMKVIENCNKE